MTMLPRAGSLGVAAGAANADVVGNPANPSAPSAIPSRRTRRRLMCDATMVQILPYGHADLLAADCSIRTVKLKAVGSAGVFAACGCGRLAQWSPTHGENWSRRAPHRSMPRRDPLARNNRL